MNVLRKGGTMDLLEKFASVEIKADNRLSTVDRQYCESQQAAYKAALTSFRELAFFAADMKSVQEELLGPRKGNTLFHDYLTSTDGPDLSMDAIQAHIEYLHTDFIQTLTRYFNESYHITVDSEEICKAILPEDPESPAGCTRAAATRYHEQMLALTVQYQSVVEQIILRLDGRSFAEQAFFELCERCHGAAWNIQKQSSKFERAKGTIRFLGNFCKYECGICEQWRLDKDMREILRGAVHFETGNFHSFPLGVPELLDGKIHTVDVVDWPSCKKIKSMKMFKNNRVDLKFASPELAREFISKYLGTVC